MFASDYVVPVLLWSINVFLDSECSFWWNPNNSRLTFGLHLKHSCSPNTQTLVGDPVKQKKAASELPLHTWGANRVSVLC